MIAQKEEALCHTISLNLLDLQNQPTRIKSGDIIDIHHDGFIKVIRDTNVLQFDLGYDDEEENNVFYLGSRFSSQMVGVIKLISSFLGLNLIILDADRDHCRFLVKESLL